MNAFLHPAHRHTIFGVLLAGIAIASTLLPLSGAESKGKKTSTKTSTEATPKPKKSSENSAASSTPKKSSTPAEKKSSSTPKRSTTPKASPKPTPKNSKSEGSTAGAEKKSAKTVANPSPSKKEQEGDAEESNEEPATSKSGDSTQQRGDSKPSAAKNQKNSKDSAAGSKPEIPGQPAPPLPAKEGSSDTDAAPAAATQPEAAAPSASATPAPSTPAPDTASKDADDESATSKKGKVSVAPNVSLAPEDLLGFELQPARVQQLIKNALDLARQKLTYTYGSADPANGGMDCSGAIQYLLTSQGFKDVPRDASGQYVWARKHGQFYAVVSKKADSFEFGDLLPGDLLFWNGTYNVQRDPPVTHTMIYLGVQRKRAQHVMWGSSDGRTYDSKPRWGVSVFDFKMPRVDRNALQPAKADFLGYARIPGLRE